VSCQRGVLSVRHVHRSSFVRRRRYGRLDETLLPGPLFVLYDAVGSESGKVRREALASGSGYSYTPQFTCTHLSVFMSAHDTLARVCLPLRCTAACALATRLGTRRCGELWQTTHSCCRACVWVCGLAARHACACLCMCVRGMCERLRRSCGSWARWWRSRTRACACCWRAARRAVTQVRRAVTRVMMAQGRRPLARSWTETPTCGAAECRPVQGRHSCLGSITRLRAYASRRSHGLTRPQAKP
jgi:hypothetical protein